MENDKNDIEVNAVPDEEKNATKIENNGRELDIIQERQLAYYIIAKKYNYESIDDVENLVEKKSPEEVCQNFFNYLYGYTSDMKIEVDNYIYIPKEYLNKHGVKSYNSLYIIDVSYEDGFFSYLVANSLGNYGEKVNIFYIVSSNQIALQEVGVEMSLLLIICCYNIKILTVCIKRDLI